MKAKVLSLQSIYDISIQYTGTVDNAFAIAKANQRSISDKLIIGEILIIPEVLQKDAKVQQYYKVRNIVPASGIKSIDALDYTFPQGELPLSI